MAQRPRQARLVYRERDGDHYIVREFSDNTPAELVFQSRNVRDVEMLLPQLQNSENADTPPQDELHRLMELAPRISEDKAIQMIADDKRRRR